jgi:oxygen-independent coproporphyrinogen-3 oxidase
MMMERDNHSIYIHVPFCVHRCAYCDFNTYAGQLDQVPAYVEALGNEIRQVGGADPIKRAVHTIFFGGGTPTLLRPADFESILKTIAGCFDLSPRAEISTEANPGTVTLAALYELRAAGLNRISFGVQSADPGELRMLERAHDFFDVIDAVAWARRAGFENLNLDLIYGLPEQALPRWQATLRRAVDLGPEHLSLYALTLEHGTPFGRWAARGLLPLPDPDLAAEMYEWAGDFLQTQGYVQYEISNWAKDDGGPSTAHRPPSQACVHNLQYWRNRPYFGFGAGAHGYVDGVRYSDVLRIRTYIERLLEPLPDLHYPLSSGAVNSHRNTPRENMQETMLTGLRLTREGVADADFRARFGLGIAEAFPREVDDLLRLGLLEWADGALRLTPPARLVSNQVFLRFVGD